VRRFLAILLIAACAVKAFSAEHPAHRRAEDVVDTAAARRGTPERKQWKPPERRWASATAAKAKTAAMAAGAARRTAAAKTRAAGRSSSGRATRRAPGAQRSPTASLPA
jgi:hypothetical protein